MRFRNFGGLHSFRSVLLAASLFLQGCGVLPFDLLAPAQTKSNFVYGSGISGVLNRIQGKVFKFIGLVVKQDPGPQFFSWPPSAYAAQCEISVQISKRGVLYLSTELTPNGSFELNGLTAVGINLKSEEGVYTIDAIPNSFCGAGNETLSRYATAEEIQDINPGTAVVTFGTALQATVQSPTALRKLQNTLLTDLASSSDTFYTQLTTDQELLDLFFAAFGFFPTSLNQVAPRITNLTMPTQVLEKTSAQFEVKANHWKGPIDYPLAYEWELDGATVSTQKTYTYSAGADDQGVKSMTLRVGKDLGNGHVDTTIPFYIKTQNFTVPNNILPVPPVLQKAGGGTSWTTNDRDLDLELVTGIGQTNCESFATLAMMEEGIIPGGANFTYTCTTAGVQPLNYTLQSLGDGAKTLTLWARDSSANFSATQKVVNILLDTTAPSLSWNTSPSGVYMGGGSVTLSFTTTDATSGVSSLSLQYKENGVAVGSAISISVPATQYAWTVPVRNSNQASVTLTATDAAGNSTSIDSPIFEVDSTAPTLAALTRVSASPSNQALVQIQLSQACTSDGGVALFLREDSNTTPALNASGWISCADIPGATPTVDYILTDTTTQGTRTVYAWVRDGVGNVSTPQSVTLTYDITAPNAPALTRTSASPTNQTTVTFSVPACTDTSHILIQESVSTPAVGAAAWQTCAVGNINVTISDTTQGLRSLYAWAKDAAGNISSATSAFEIVFDNVAPTIQSVTLAGGAANTGTVFLPVDVAATDPNSGTKIRIKESGVADCASVYADDSWQNHTGGIAGSTQNYAFTLTPVDGLKRICVWAKDAVGNVSNPTQATILFEIGNLPQITAFSVTNTNDGTKTFAIGDPVSIAFTIEDQEALHTNPVSIWYSTNNSTWIPIVSDYGGLAAGTKTYTHTYAWTAPVDTYFRLRIVAKDESGNNSPPVLSDTMNTPNWSIFMGTTDHGIGSSAAATAYRHTQTWNNNRLAQNPLTGDLYILSHGMGVVKLNAATGLSELWLKTSGTALSDGATLTSTHGATVTGILNDSHGNLYLGISNRIWQINPNTGYIRLYAGGGSEYDDGASPDSLRLILNNKDGDFTIDESNSIYVSVRCLSASPLNGIRLFKIPQKSDQTADTSIHVAGNCAWGTPINGADAKETPVADLSNGAVQQFRSGTLTAFNNGNAIYFSSYRPYNVFKILNGVMRPSNLGAYGIMSYNPNDQRLYYVGSGSVQRITPNLNGANSDTASTYISATGSGASPLSCSDDGVLRTQGCVYASLSYPLYRPDGTLMFTDGAGGVINGYFRVRYLDQDQKIRTLTGSRPLYGEGLHRNLVRGSFGGLYYKKASEQNLAHFPAGLYVAESQGASLLHVPSDDLVSIRAGDQSQKVYPATGTVFNAEMSLGKGQDDDFSALTFDNSGLPWMRLSNASGSSTGKQICSVNSNNEFVRRTNGSNWQSVAASTNAFGGGMYASGAMGNLIARDNSVYLFGIDRNRTNPNTCPCPNNPALLNKMDFTANTVSVVMGDGTDALPTDTTPVLASTIKMPYTLTVVIQPSYSDPERIYFRSGTRIYAIDGISDPATATVQMIVNTGRTTYQFIPSEDESMIFYLGDSGLYCINVNSANAWCNNTLRGPNSPMPSISTAGNRPHQMTWKSATELLISTYTGLIYKYDLP